MKKHKFKAGDIVKVLGQDLDSYWPSLVRGGLQGEDDVIEVKCQDSEDGTFLVGPRSAGPQDPNSSHADCWWFSDDNIVLEGPPQASLEDLIAENKSIRNKVYCMEARIARNEATYAANLAAIQEMGEDTPLRVYVKEGDKDEDWGWNTEGKMDYLRGTVVDASPSDHGEGCITVDGWWLKPEWFVVVEGSL